MFRESTVTMDSVTRKNCTIGTSEIVHNTNGGEKKISKPTKKGIFQPRLILSQKAEEYYDTMYLTTLREALFTHFEKPYKAPTIPSSLSQDGDKGIQYVCRQCKDSFHMLKSLEDHNSRGSWILGYWCVYCFQECEHSSGKSIHCDKCMKLQIQKYNALQSRGLKKSDEPGIVRVFFNPCQLLEHMQMHDTEEILIDRLMLLPFPSGIGKEYYPHLKMISEALMDCMFLTKVHIVDWLLKNKIHKWWRMAKGDNPVANIIKKYPFEVQQIKQLLNCNNKVNQIHRFSVANTDNEKNHDQEKSMINSSSSQSMSKLTPHDKSASSSQTNSESADDITFVDCGSHIGVKKQSNSEIATNAKISVKNFAKLPSSPSTNGSTRKIKCTKVTTNKSVNSPVTSNSRIVTIRSAKSVNLSSIIKNFPQIAQRVSNKKIVLMHKTKDLNVKDLNILQSDNVQKIKKSQKVVQIHKVQNGNFSNGSKSGQTSSSRIFISDGHQIKTKMIKKPELGSSILRTYSKANKSILKSNVYNQNATDVATSHKQMLPVTSNIKNQSFTEDSNLKIVNTFTLNTSELELYFADIRDNTRKVLKKFFREDELMYLTVIINEKSGKSFLSLLRNKNNLNIIDKLHQKNKMLTYFSTLNKCKINQRINHIKIVSRQYSKKLNISNDENIEEHKKLIFILEKLAAGIDTTQVSGDDYFGPQVVPAINKMCKNCKKIIKPPEFLIGFTQTLVNKDYCLCYNNICYICNNYQGNKTRFLNHLGYHNLEKPFFCPECNVVFCSQKSLNVHMWTRCFHLLIKRFLSCSICGIKGFCSEESMINHCILMHSIKMSACTYCCMVFDYKRYCMSHIKRGHSEVVDPLEPLQLIVCQLDDKILPVECYSNHIKCHKFIEEFVVYKCSLCHNAVFTTPESIKSHLYGTHYTDLSSIIDKDVLNEILLINDIKQLIGDNLSSIVLEAKPKTIVNDSADTTNGKEHDIEQEPLQIQLKQTVFNDDNLDDTVNTLRRKNKLDELNTDKYNTMEGTDSNSKTIVNSKYLSMLDKTDDNSNVSMLNEKRNIVNNENIIIQETDQNVQLNTENIIEKEDITLCSQISNKKDNENTNIKAKIGNEKHLRKVGNNKCNNNNALHEEEEPNNTFDDGKSVSSQSSSQDTTQETINIPECDKSESIDCTEYLENNEKTNTNLLKIKDDPKPDNSVLNIVIANVEKNNTSSSCTSNKLYDKTDLMKNHNKEITLENPQHPVSSEHNLSTTVNLNNSVDTNKQIVLNNDQVNKFGRQQIIIDNDDTEYVTLTRIPSEFTCMHSSSLEIDLNKQDDSNGLVVDKEKDEKIFSYTNEKTKENVHIKESDVTQLNKDMQIKKDLNLEQNQSKTNNNGTERSTMNVVTLENNENNKNENMKRINETIASNNEDEENSLNLKDSTVNSESEKYSLELEKSFEETDISVNIDCKRSNVTTSLESKLNEINESIHINKEEQKICNTFSNNSDNVDNDKISTINKTYSEKNYTQQNVDDVCNSNIENHEEELQNNTLFSSDNDVNTKHLESVQDHLSDADICERLPIEITKNSDNAEQIDDSMSSKMDSSNKSDIEDMSEPAKHCAYAALDHDYDIEYLTSKEYCKESEDSENVIIHRYSCESDENGICNENDFEEFEEDYLSHHGSDTITNINNVEEDNDIEEQNSEMQIVSNDEIELTQLIDESNEIVVNKQILVPDSVSESNSINKHGIEVEDNCLENSKPPSVQPVTNSIDKILDKVQIENDNKVNNNELESEMEKITDNVDNVDNVEELEQQDELLCGEISENSNDKENLIENNKNVLELKDKVSYVIPIEKDSESKAVDDKHISNIIENHKTDEENNSLDADSSKNETATMNVKISKLNKTDSDGLTSVENVHMSKDGDDVVNDSISKCENFEQLENNDSLNIPEKSKDLIENTNESIEMKIAVKNLSNRKFSQEIEESDESTSSIIRDNVDHETIQQLVEENESKNDKKIETLNCPMTKKANDLITAVLSSDDKKNVPSTTNINEKLRCTSSTDSFKSKLLMENTLTHKLDDTCLISIQVINTDNDKSNDYRLDSEDSSSNDFQSETSKSNEYYETTLQCNNYELKNLPITDDEKLTLSKTSVNDKPINVNIESPTGNIKQLRKRIVNKLNSSSEQYMKTKRKSYDLQDRKKETTKKTKIDLKESRTRKQKLEEIKTVVNSKTKLRKIVFKDDVSNTSNVEVKETTNKRNLKRNRSYPIEENSNSKVNVKDAALVQMPTLRLIKAPVKLNVVNQISTVKVPKLKAVKKYKIGFYSGIEVPTKICKFKCHLCGDAINTSWSTISEHYIKKHSHNYELCTISPKLHRLSDDDLGLKLNKKRKMSEASLMNLKKKKRCSPKTNEKSGLFVQLESIVDGEGNFKCKKCEERCVDMVALRQHIVDQHRIAKKNLICLECGENFVVSPSLQMHLKAFHGINDPISYMNDYPEYAPDIVDFEAETKTVTANQCYVCMAVFKDKSAVDKHLRVHGMAFLNRKRIEARNAQISPNKKDKHHVLSTDRELRITQETQRNKNVMCSNSDKTIMNFAR